MADAPIADVEVMLTASPATGVKLGDVTHDFTVVDPLESGQEIGTARLWAFAAPVHPLDWIAPICPAESAPPQLGVVPAACGPHELVVAFQYAVTVVIALALGDTGCASPLEVAPVYVIGLPVVGVTFV